MEDFEKKVANLEKEIEHYRQALNDAQCALESAEQEQDDLFAYYGEKDGEGK